MIEAVARGDLRNRGAVCAIRQTFTDCGKAEPAKVAERSKTEENAKVALQRTIGDAAGRGQIGHRDLATESAPHEIDGSHDVAGKRLPSRALRLIVLIERCH